MDTLIEHLHALELPTPFPIGPITVYLADAPGEPLSLIDTGPLTGETWAALQAGLARHGCRPADLERVVITHAHVDHYGLAADLVAASGAEVVSHPWNGPLLADDAGLQAQRTAFYADLFHKAALPAELVDKVSRVSSGMRRFARPVAAGMPVDDGAELRLAGRNWRVLHTPGHAGGLICLYEPGSRTLLSSDHLLADISSNPVVEPPPPGHSDRLRSLAVYQASLRRVAAMDVARALPSHGPAIDDVPGLVAGRLAFHQKRVERVLAALHAGARTTWEVTSALFGGRGHLDIFLAVSEVIGHLDLLEAEGLVTAESAGRVVLWRAAL